jgi:SulP family sulfate permease
LPTAAFKFNRLEFAGSLGDLGTLIPMSIALIAINGLSVTPVLVMAGLFYIVSGIYFKLPIPVQPLKVVFAIAIANPAAITAPVISAAGILFGIVLLVLGFTGLIDRLAQYFNKPIVRGIQFGLGLILIQKGIAYILKNELLIQQPSPDISIFGIPFNLIIGLVAFLVVLLLLSNRRFPAALVIIFAGMAIGIIFGGLNQVDFNLGPTPVKIGLPGMADFSTALVLLILPQIPLTVGNAIIGTADTCYSLFGQGKQTERISYRAFSLSMGFTNLIAGLIGAMPMCHGAGGLAAHYRFGARTGGSNLMIGFLFVALGFLCGEVGMSLLGSIPNGVFGVLLLFAGIELSLLIQDVTKKEDLFITLLIAGIGLATNNMAAAFVIGIIITQLTKLKNVNL